MLEVRLLGTFEVKHQRKTIPISSRPAQSLFAYLIFKAGIAHRREKLAGMLWPDSLEETARDNLRHALWRIRKALPSKPKVEYLLTDDLSIAFNKSAEYWLDTAVLEQLRESSPADELLTVLSEYHGELLPGFYEEWVLLEREHLKSAFEHHMARLMSLLQAEGRWLDILEWGERWIKLGQKPEPAYRALMSAHAAKGDMSKVVGTYERCVQSLKEFGIEPSEQTRALYDALRTRPERHETSSKFQVATKPSASAKSNLPVPLTSFIGRQTEVDTILDLLAKNRLLTLTGAGGVGKTRLAIQAANKLMGKFKDGVWWVDLVGLNDPGLVPQAVAKTIDVHEVPNQSLIETLALDVQKKQMLLVLDNCEHLIVACAQLADRLLSNAKNLKIITTSRESLDILGETVWLVPSLALPDPRESSGIRVLSKYESVRLFVERTTAIKPQFILTDQNAASIVQICRRLSGMPLAIELAAARVRMMSVDEIASRLDDRFDLLTSGSRAALPRHQTLRATIDWSYDLLNESEKLLFQRIAVFAGGFTLATAEAVCGYNGLKAGEIVDLLGRLVDKSLVLVEQSPLEATRYRMLETIREYAQQRVEDSGESVHLQNRHLEYFVNLAEEAERNTFGAQSVKYHRMLDEELDDIRTAMEWAIRARQSSMAFRLGAALFYFWYNRSPIGGEWQRQLNKALQLSEGTDRTRERAQALNAKGYFYWADVIPENPRAHLEEALSIGRELRDDQVVARSLLNIGLVETVEGNYSEARSFFEMSLDLFRKVDSPGMEYIWPLTFLGDTDFSQSDLDAARVHYEQSVRDLRTLQDRNFLAYVVRRLGQLSWHCGEFEEAAQLCEESLILNQELGDERGVLASLIGFAGIATARGRWGTAATLFGAAEKFLAARNIRLVHMDSVERDRNVAILRERVEPLSLEKAWKKGSSMTLKQAVALALKEK